METNQIVDHFYKYGHMLEVEGNKPFMLDDHESVYIVASGMVDVFSVELESGAPVSRRDHIFRGKPGQSLFGINPDRVKRKTGFLITGSPGTKLLCLKKSLLQQMGKDSKNREAVINLLETWVGQLAAGLCKGVPPKKFEHLQIGQELLLQNKVTLQPIGEVLWIKHLEGSSVWMSQNDLPLIRDKVFFPVSPGTWLTLAEQSKLSVVATRDYIEQEPAWNGLEKFHTAVLDYVALNTREAKVGDIRRIKEREENDRQVLQRAVDKLAAVSEVAKKGAVKHADAGDPLLAACRMVGDVLGINFQSHPARQNDSMSGDALGDIARVSQVRTRQVILKGEWWCTDNGPLLAYSEEDGCPVALLPIKAHKYELHDPVQGTKTLVTPQVAQTLKPFAHTFYRPFPARPLNLLDLLKVGLVGGWKQDALRVMLTGLAGGVLGLFLPVATGILFDTVIPEAERGQLWQMTLILLAGAVAAFMFQMSRSIAMLRLEGKMDAVVQSAVWDRLLSLPVPFFRQYSAGELAVRSMGINEMRKILSGVTMVAIFSSLFSFFNFILLFYYNVQLAWLASGLVIICLVVMVFLGYLQAGYQRKVIDIERKISGLVLQIINGITKFRVAGAESRAYSLWTQYFSQQRKFTFQTRMIANYLAVFNSSFPIFASMVIFSSVISSSGSLSTGNFLAFFVAFNTLLAALLALSNVFLATLYIIPLYEGAKPILQALPEVDEAKADPGEMTGEIEVSHVSFRYKEDTPLILQDVSLHINSGEFVALVGQSGSGKSTLFRLLLGFETPESGAIYYDGQDFAGLDVRAVRSQMGVVIQSGKLMSGDIFTNIIGSANLTIDDAWEAARMTGLDEDIRQMPMGMHSVVSEGAKTLSGGQRQRLLIARAIVKRPRIIYFDEATSALDNKTQAIVSQSLEGFQATRIVIAHRLSTIINADRIYVLDKGIIVQSGTYKELVNQEGLFADLAKRQIA